MEIGTMRAYSDLVPYETEREVELKERLVEIDQRYRQEAQPILDELAMIANLKTPRVLIVPD
jgi:hypothetical protein